MDGMNGFSGQFDLLQTFFSFLIHLSKSSFFGCKAIQELSSDSQHF